MRTIARSTLVAVATLGLLVPLGTAHAEETSVGATGKYLKAAKVDHGDDNVTLLAKAKVSRTRKFVGATWLLDTRKKKKADFAVSSFDGMVWVTVDPMSDKAESVECPEAVSKNLPHRRGVRMTVPRTCLADPEGIVPDSLRARLQLEMAVKQNGGWGCGFQFVPGQRGYLPRVSAGATPESSGRAVAITSALRRGC